jgi:hypothetical protein
MIPNECAATVTSIQYRPDYRLIPGCFSAEMTSFRQGQSIGNPRISGGPPSCEDYGAPLNFLKGTFW